MQRPSNRGSLLIVDDNQANLKILKTTFSDEGFQVATASSVEEARVFLSANPGFADLVLSDIQMPAESGFDLVRWLKSEPPLADTPILLITSQLPEPEHRVLGLSLGAVDYVLRSLDPAELVLRVSHAIDHVRRVNGLRLRLEDSESLAMVGRFLAASNHEIKNLAAIITSASAILARSMTQQDQRLDEGGKKAFAALSHAAELLANVSRSTSRLVGSQALELTSVDLSKIVTEVAAMAAPLLKGIYVDAQIEPGTWVLASRTQLSQMLVNLLLNAREAIEEFAPRDGGFIKVTVTPAADQVTITVRDNGMGFKTAERRTSFPAFASTKQMRGGQGLGLWLCSRFAVAMRGSLALSSEGPGRGATAELCLRPAAPEDLIDLTHYIDD